MVENAEGRALSPGSRGPDVVQLQRRLIELGYLKGFSDGIYGPQTVEAVRKFQKSKHLKVDGVAGTETLFHLFLQYP